MEVAFPQKLQNQASSSRNAQLNQLDLVEVNF